MRFYGYAVLRLYGFTVIRFYGYAVLIEVNSRDNLRVNLGVEVFRQLCAVHGEFLAQCRGIELHHESLVLDEEILGERVYVFANDFRPGCYEAALE